LAFWPARIVLVCFVCSFYLGWWGSIPTGPGTLSWIWFCFRSVSSDAGDHFCMTSSMKTWGGVSTVGVLSRRCFAAEVSRWHLVDWFGFLDDAVGFVPLALLVPLDAFQVERSQGPKLLGPASLPGCTVHFLLRLGQLLFWLAIELRLKLGDFTFQAFHFPIARFGVFLHGFSLAGKLPTVPGVLPGFVSLLSGVIPLKLFCPS
jgi:hypothetical protein